MKKILTSRLLHIFLILLLSFLLFTFRLTEVPPGINSDEGSIGYNASLIAKTGHDSEGRLLPLFTKSEGSMDWKQPITVYTTALVFKLLGTSYFNLRLSSFFIAVISAFTIFLLVRELMGTRMAFLGLIIFATSPIIMIQSHLALENIAPVPFVALWLLVLAKYKGRKNKVLLLFAGIFLGLGIFSYLGMRMIVPVLTFLTIGLILYLNYGKKGDYINSIKWFVLGISPFLIILFLSKFYYPGAILGLYRPYQIENYQNLLLPYLSTFDPSFLYVSGDSTLYHSTGKHGMMLIASLPLFILGLIYVIRNKPSMLIFILISFFLTPMLFGFGSTIHRASRLLALLPAYIVITAAGFLLINKIKLFFVKSAIYILVFLLIFLNFSDFLHDYWYEYPQRVRAEFLKPVHKAYKQLKQVSGESQLEPLMQTGLLGGTKSDGYIFLEKLYFSTDLKEWPTNEKIPAKSVILVDFPKITSNNVDKEKISIVRIDDLDYYLLINESNNEI